MRHVLEHIAAHRAPFIKKALYTFPEPDKASEKAISENTQEVKDEVRDKLGERLANNIANASA